MDRSWAEIISDLQGEGMTYAQIGEAIGCAGSTVGDLASGRSQSPRASGAIALLGLHRTRVAGQREGAAACVGAQVYSRISKRALRAKFGFKTDAHLAKVLQLPVEQVEAWQEEQDVSAFPQVLQLLSVQDQAATTPAPTDPDADRVIQVQVA